MSGAVAESRHAGGRAPREAKRPSRKKAGDRKKRKEVRAEEPDTLPESPIGGGSGGGEAEPLSSGGFGAPPLRGILKSSDNLTARGASVSSNDPQRRLQSGPKEVKFFLENTKTQRRESRSGRRLVGIIRRPSASPRKFGLPKGSGRIVWPGQGSSSHGGSSVSSPPNLAKGHRGSGTSNPSAASSKKRRGAYQGPETTAADSTTNQPSTEPSFYFGSTQASTGRADNRSGRKRDSKQRVRSVGQKQGGEGRRHQRQRRYNNKHRDGDDRENEGNDSSDEDSHRDSSESHSVSSAGSLDYRVHVSDEEPVNSHQGCCSCCWRRSSAHTSSRDLSDSRKRGSVMAPPIVGPSALATCLYVFLCVTTLGLFTLFLFNEWKIVASRRHFLPLINHYMPVSCEPDDRFNKRLVHIDCPLRNLQTFYPPTEFSWNVESFRGVFFEMKVEMYQWTVHTAGLKFKVGGRWSESLVDNAAFPFAVYDGVRRSNPDFFPHYPGSGRHFAADVYAGGYRLSSKHLVDFRAKRQLPIKEDGYYHAPEERPPTYVDYSNTQAYGGNALYTGDPLNAKVGDLRITFWGSTATHASALSMQARDDHFGKDYVLQPYPNPQNDNRTIEIVHEGDMSAEQLFLSAVAREDSEQWLAWTARGAALISAFLFFFYSHRICDVKRRHELVFVALGAACLGIASVTVVCSTLWMSCSLVIGVSLVVVAGISLVAAVVLWCRPPKVQPVVLESLEPYGLGVGDGTELLPIYDGHQFSAHGIHGASGAFRHSPSTHLAGDGGGVSGSRRYYHPV